jgi:hypothetical protein
VIEGKVARILNSRELVINRGVTDGVKVGMRFEVLDPNSEDIQDPDTQEVIGSVYRPKVNVEAVIVEDRLSVARTYERTGGTAGIGILGLNRAFYGEPSRPVSLKTDEEVWEPLTEAESYVKTGDPVREILAEDET